MRYFPVFVDLENRKVVVVGGSEEAVRKVRLLRKTNARIQVIAASLHSELNDDRVEWLSAEYKAELLDGAALVYSADAQLNEMVSADAQLRGIPVNAVDQAEISTFIVPSIVDRDPIVIAIGTEGTAPVLGQKIRAQIDQMLPTTTGFLASTAAKLRARVAEHVPHGNRRRAFWQRFFFGEPRDALLSGDHAAFELALGDAMYFEAQPSTGKLDTITLQSNDPEMLTIRAHRLLQEADVIIHDRTAPSGVLEMARRDATRVSAEDNSAANYLKKGLRVVNLVSPSSAQIVPFPIREDIKEAALRAVS
jgi:uroporphyrin-III C-methyltransferase / precorrin-2 dehydrogenase / sirohydrochlorin ferrochelatase